jgi:hypothetical protein
MGVIRNTQDVFNINPTEIESLDIRVGRQPISFSLQ